MPPSVKAHIIEPRTGINPFENMDIQLFIMGRSSFTCAVLGQMALIGLILINNAFVINVEFTVVNCAL